MLANDQWYVRAHELVFNGNYPGYQPNVVESPHGDGNWDEEKRYAHIAEKYLDKCNDDRDREFLSNALDSAVWKAKVIAMQLGIPSEYWPDRRYSAIRILEYPPGVGSHQHTDFDLFTLVLYRSDWHHFQYPGEGEGQPLTGYLGKACKMSRGFHFGEMMEHIKPRYIATPHAVAPSVTSQYSAVFFAIPDHASLLKDGTPVGDWVAERKARSRKERT
jgi:hypothetical protein